MILLGNFMLGVAAVLNLVLGVVLLLVIVRAVASWVSADPYNPIMRFLIDATEPMLKPFRRVIPIVGRGLDLSPLALIAAIYFLQAFLVGSLEDYGRQLKFSAARPAVLVE